MIPFGQSCIEEIKALDGYQKSDQKIELNLGYHGLSINGVLQEEQAEYFIEFENEPEDVINTSKMFIHPRITESPSGSSWDLSAFFT